MKGHKCLSQTKGRQPLNMCIGCHKKKLSCQTNGAGSQKKVAMVPEEEEEEEDSTSEESDGSRKGWLQKFSTMKVGPPKGARPAAN